MFQALSPGTIGVKFANLSDAIAAARRHGFAGLEVGAAQVAELVDREGAGVVRQLFADAGIVPAGWGLPVDWRTSDENWQRDLAQLPRLAQAAAAIGARRCFTWVMPCSKERALGANLRFHIERFTPIATILADHGCALGLEFLGPKTLRESQPFPFIHRMQDMLALGREIGPNVGLLLDCWHWHTSGATLADIRALRPEQVVYIHVNDAPRGVAMERFVDNVRGLPGETGVIDIAGFLAALRAIGYDGPVVPEPFKQELKQLPSDEARLTVVAAAMAKIFSASRAA